MKPSNTKFLSAAIGIHLAAAAPLFAAATIESRVAGGEWQKTSAISPLKGQAIELRTAKVPGAKIRWYQIFPDVSEIYKNANHPWEPQAYKWVGFSKIKYYREEIRGFRGRWSVRILNKGHLDQDFSNKSALSRYFQRDVGSFWFQVEVEKNGEVQSSPGLKSSDHRGLSPKVFRVSVRDGKGYIGYLTSFFNVPAIFGSVPHQSNNFIGADCADILIAARGKWKKKTPARNYNVAMLVQKFKTVAEFDLDGGEPDRKVLWGEQIKPGDFIAVRYRGARRYQHIGALFSDSNKNGSLDPGDVVIHAGPYPLDYEVLSSGAFDGHVSILRH